MESQRQQKVAKLLLKELSSVFQKQIQASFGNVLVTITKVSVTSDLSIARVYVSVFGSQDGKTFIKEVINPQIKEIRYLLGQIIRHQVRSIPELVFYLDDSLDYIERIDQLLKN